MIGVYVMEKAKKPFYKKWWFWVIIVIVIAAFGSTLDDEDPSKNDEKSEPSSTVTESTDDNDQNEESTSNTDTEEAEEEKTNFGINEEIEFGDRIVAITDVEYSDGNDFDKPQEGKEYVIVSVTIENDSDEEISYNPLHFKMQNSQGQIEDKAFTVVDSDTALSSGDLAPGGSVSGTITFEQPKDDGELILIFEPGFWSNKRITIDLN